MLTPMAVRPAPVGPGQGSGLRCGAALLLLALAGVAAPRLGAAVEPNASPPSASASTEYRFPEDAAALLLLDDEMRAFFAARVRRYAPIETRLDLISTAILSPEGLGFRYEPFGLYDVREAFRRRAGNCLTFSALFIAVAREYGIAAVFNHVPTAPTWDRVGGIVLESRHIDVRVETSRCRYEIDLDLAQDFRLRRAASSPIDDKRAFSAMYSNAGVYRLVAEDLPGALALLRRATRIDPSYTAAWTNLGGAHLIAGEPQEAQNCYLRALEEEPGSLAAISGLARAYREMGRADQAAALDRRAAHYRERNPYYLLFVARSELAADRPEAARRLLARAFRIKRDEPEILEALVEVSRRLGRPGESARWARRLEALQREAPKRAG